MHMAEFMTICQGRSQLALAAVADTVHPASAVCSAVHVDEPRMTTLAESKPFVRRIARRLFARPIPRPAHFRAGLPPLDATLLTLSLISSSSLVSRQAAYAFALRS